jgi:hypothetical protein
MNFLSIITLIRSLGPSLFIVADAFRYGMLKYGNDSWKQTAAETHLQIAGEEAISWIHNRSNYSLLASASLRMLFALALCATSKQYVPKSKVEENVQKPE